jgi:integrase
MEHDKTIQRQRFLPLELWPEADRTAWLQAIEPGALLEHGGTAGHLSEIYKYDLERRYGYFLSFARSQGVLIRDGEPAASLIAETIAAYVELLQTIVSPVTTGKSIYKISRMAQFIAPDLDWEWLRSISIRLQRAAYPQDKRPRLVDVDRLYALGFKMMERSRLMYSGTFAQAILYRDGLILALLSTCVLRRANFVSLELDRTLVQVGETWMITLPASETKSNRPIEMVLPLEIGKTIDEFLANHRKRFKNAAAHNFLWPSRHGNPLSASALTLNIRRQTRDAFGKAICPHLIRSCAATTIARRHGSSIRIVAPLLTHTNHKTSEKHYIHAEMITALNAYQAMILGENSKIKEESHG